MTRIGRICADLQEKLGLRMLHGALTEEIIGASYDVYNTLGFGFLEKVYENAMLLELTKRGMNCWRQAPLQVKYNGQVVGEYFADIVVNESVILELKATEKLVEEHSCQLLNYLRATDMEVGLLLNFGRQPRFKRIAFSHTRKPSLSL